MSPPSPLPPCSERFSSPCWYRTTPDAAKLTEEDIDVFVACLIPAMKMAIFSKIGTLEAALTLHNLALVRPEMVIPDLLNRYMYYIRMCRWLSS